MKCREGHKVDLDRSGRLIDAETVTATTKTTDVRKLHLNIFDSSVSDLQQGWRLVVAACRQAQTELEL